MFGSLDVQIVYVIIKLSSRFPSYFEINDKGANFLCVGLKVC